MDSPPRYKIKRRISSGAFSSVYLAQDGADSPLVALKLVHTEAARIAENVQLLHDEGRLLQLIDHPGVVKCFNCVQLIGRPCLVLEYIDGPPLDHFMRGPKLPMHVALHLISALSQSLHHCYTMLGPEGRPFRLIHRDIKPANVVLTTSGVPKLLDFGIAQAVFADRVALSLESHMGTASYMSPERFEMLDGPAGDVYALGVMLLSLLSGEALGKTSAHQKKHQIKIRGAIEHLQSVRPVPDGLRVLLERCLCFDPKERPSAGQLSTELEQLSQTLPPPELSAVSWLKQALRSYSPPEEPFQDTLVGQTLSCTPDVFIELPNFLEAPTGEFSPVFPEDEPLLPPLTEEPSDYWELDDIEQIQFDETEESPSAGPGIALPSFDGPWAAQGSTGEHLAPPPVEVENPRVGRFLGLLLLISLALAVCMGLSS